MFSLTTFIPKVNLCDSSAQPSFHQQSVKIDHFCDKLNLWSYQAFLLVIQLKK